MSFHFHSTASEHPAFQNQSGHAAFVLWVRCGTWTSTHGSTGVVPKRIAEEYGTPDLIKTLIDHGLWSEVGRGYEMWHGPSHGMPSSLWQYDRNSGDKDLLGAGPAIRRQTRRRGIGSF